MFNSKFENHYLENSPSLGSGKYNLTQIQYACDNIPNFPCKELFKVKNNLDDFAVSIFCCY